MPYKFTYAVQY